MKLSIQRGCDGVHPDIGDPKETCEARLEVTFEVRDRDHIREWQETYERAAVAAGFRRIGGAVDHVEWRWRTDGSPEVVVIPDAKTWVVCPVHAKGTVCARCGFESCSCMGGPRFDVRIGDDS